MNSTYHSRLIQITNSYSSSCHRLTYYEYLFCLLISFLRVCSVVLVTSTGTVSYWTWSPSRVHDAAVWKRLTIGFWVGQEGLVLSFSLRRLPDHRPASLTDTLPPVGAQNRGHTQEVSFLVFKKILVDLNKLPLWQTACFFIWGL